LAAGDSPVRIHYRDVGDGPPIVFLHGGWGYEIYPFGRQIAALAPRHRIIIPDRSGYGGSPPIDALPADFHSRAVAETRAVIDALGLERPMLWGHSDGAIVALLLGLAAPGRIAGTIVEATHYVKRKPGSRAFFESMLDDPAASLGTTVVSVLTRDHGDRWRRVIELHSRAWLQIADRSASADEDFYGGRLRELQVPVLVVHGARDPRTEPGELDVLRANLPSAEFAVFDAGGHSPHSERVTAARPADPVPPAAPVRPAK
jgi:pimeloyl-ACP methyl ester carboxylesterase